MFCSLYYSGDDAQLRSISTIVSGAVAALLFVIIIILVVLIVILYLRKKSQRKQKLLINPEAVNNTHSNSGKCTHSTEPLIQLSVLQYVQYCLNYGNIEAHKYI